MKTYNIAVLPGDGIGPEVTTEAINVLNALATIDRTIHFNFTEFLWNSERYLTDRAMMPKDGLEQLTSFDAILFGAVGDDRVPADVSIWELILPIRKQFQQYINLRPITRLNGLPSPLKNDKPVDFVIVRENAEGEYIKAGGSLYTGEEAEVAVQNTIMTKQGIERVAQFAYDYAQANGYQKVTNATKSNVVVHTMKLWDRTVETVAANYPNIAYEKVYIDTLAAQFIQRPESYDVVVASNLFGDILSDLGSSLVGGLGLAPSANINPEKKYPSMFEAIHGSAPDIVGKGIANPMAQIWSAGLMLYHFGRPDLYNYILQAIEAVLVAGEVLTPDLGGQATTKEVGQAIINELKK